MKRLDCTKSQKRDKIWDGTGEKLGEDECKKMFNIPDLKMLFFYFFHYSFNNLLVKLS